MSQTAYEKAAQLFRKRFMFPRNWRHLDSYPYAMECFCRGYLAGYNDSNVMHAKKRGRK